jgi:cytochrome c biogenesis protein
MLIRFLSSLKLTLALLLGLSLVSIFGTLGPGEMGRFDLFYQSAWFRALLGLLALNMGVCTVKTIVRNLGDKARFFEVLRSELVFSRSQRYLLPSDLEVAAAGEGLRQLGYRLYLDGEQAYARKGPWGRWGSTIVHVSFLGIMLGALLAETGFVGTLNIYVGDKSPVYFDWEEQRDLPLPFEFRLDYFEPIYYPIEVRFGALRSDSGERIAAFEGKEGETVQLPVPGMSAKILKFLPREKQIILGIYSGGRYLGEYRATDSEKRYEGEGELPLAFVPIAFREPMLKQLRSDVSIIEGGRVVAQGTIKINHPLTYNGISIYQTAFDRDKFGNWYAGFQFSKDPGEPVVWVGCILMVLGLAIAFAVPFRAVGITRIDGEVLLVTLAGFRGEGGSREFERLERHLVQLLAR